MQSVTGVQRSALTASGRAVSTPEKTPTAVTTETVELGQGTSGPALLHPRDAGTSGVSRSDETRTVPVSATPAPSPRANEAGALGAAIEHHNAEGNGVRVAAGANQTLVMEAPAPVTPQAVAAPPSSVAALDAARLASVRQLSARLDQAPTHVNVAAAALLHYANATAAAPSDPLATYFPFAQDLQKLALAAMQTEMVGHRLSAAGVEPDRKALLTEEVRTQIGSFALGHCLDDATCTASLEAAQAEATRQQALGRPYSETSLLVAEMDRRVDPSRREDFDRAVAAQPLTHVLYRNADVIDDLAASLPQDQGTWRQLHAASREVLSAFQHWAQAAS